VDPSQAFEIALLIHRDELPSLEEFDAEDLRMIVYVLVGTLEGVMSDDQFKYLMEAAMLEHMMRREDEQEDE